MGGSDHAEVTTCQLVCHGSLRGAILLFLSASLYSKLSAGAPGIMSVVVRGDGWVVHGWDGCHGTSYLHRCWEHRLGDAVEEEQRIRPGVPNNRHIAKIRSAHFEEELPYFLTHYSPVQSSQY